MKIENTIGLFISLLLILASCSGNRLNVDISQTAVDQDFYYVDGLLSNVSKQELTANHAMLQKKLGSLYMYEWRQNLRMNSSDSIENKIYQFYNAEYIKDLEKSKNELIPKIMKKENRITDAFRYFTFHFKSAPLPYRVIYMNKLFSNIHCSDSAITIAPESYLDSESEIISSIPKNQLYEWQKNRMDLQYLERDIAFNWIQVQLFDEIDKQLAQHIIQAGKILYATNACFPEAEESYILRYSEQDWNWAEQNEDLTWDHLVKEQLLFKNNRRDKANFLNAGPTTVGLPDESPDRMGQFLGYKMVKGFMEENKKVSLQELLKIDYNKILQSYEID